MADELRVVITAKDGASRVFKEVGTAAKGVGDQAEKAGQQGERGFKRMGDAAQKTKVDTAALGAALTALGAGMAYSSAMAMQQERQLIGLNRAFGDNADAVIRYAEELDNVTIFSDDDIRAGQRYFATLQNNYDMSIDQIKDLMATTAELAAASGTSFEDASSRVTAAIRGEGEAAEYLNLTMNQQAIDRNNVTLSMTNQEAAQFRLNALNEQAAVYIGTNNDLLQTGIGTMAEWADRAQDMGATVGGWVGPMGAAVSSVGMLGFGLTGMAGGFNLVTTAAVRNALAVKGSAIAMRGLSLMAGPVGLVTAGVGLLSLAFYQNQKQAAEAAAVIAILKDQYLDLKVAADAAGDSGDLATEARLNQLRHQVESVRAEADLIVETMEDSSQFKLFGKDYDRDAWFELKKAYEINDAEAQSLADSQLKLGAAMQDNTIDAEALSVAQGDLYNQFIRQEITADQFIMLMADLASRTNEYKLAADDAADSTDGVTRTIHGFNEALLANAEAAVRSALGIDKYVEAIQDLSDNAIAGVTDGLENLTAARAKAFAGIGSDFLGIATAETEEYAEWLGVVTTNLQALMEVSGYSGLDIAATDMRIYALEAMNAGTALDTVFRATVGNTNAIANQSQAIADWADELIGAQGEASKLDDLVNAGRISGTSGDFSGNSEYAQAQRAYNDLARENAEIQEHVLTIQAKQAPLVRDQLAAYEDLMQDIADMPADQQLITLGWMDSTAAMRAMEFQTLAVAAANGELGANGEAVFESMITGAAAADPVLAALLEDMGLISVGADGTITVNLEGAEGARSEIGLLTDAIVGFIDLMDDGELNGSFSITAEDNATPTLDSIQSQRDGLDGSNANVTVTTVDNASSTMDYITNQLGLLDGKTATTYIRTMYETYGTVPGYVGPTMQNGGVVDSYATGGVVIHAAEVGPEIIHYANGGTAVMPYDGLYTVPEHSYISPAHASQSRLDGGGLTVNVSIGGSVVTEDDIAAMVAEKLVPAIERANVSRRRQMGVA